MQAKYFLLRGREAIGGKTGGHLVSVCAVSLGGILAKFWPLWRLRVVWEDSHGLERREPSRRCSKFNRRGVEQFDDDISWAVVGGIISWAAFAEIPRRRRQFWPM
jgi:hypothetical protein